MRVGYLTDKGMKRPKNEDAVKVLKDSRFFMLADGVGGNKSGEIASTAAVDFLADYVYNNPCLLHKTRVRRNGDNTRFCIC